MTDPTGWQLIEDWRNGVISDVDFASLQDLLRADAEVRQTLRRSMTMDSALRDRAEAELLAPEAETEFAEALRESSQSSRDAGILAAERTITDGQWASKPAVMRLMLATAAVVIVALSAGLIYQLAYPVDGVPKTNNVATQLRDSDPSVAKITGLSGALIWTGDRGQIVRDVKIGTELAGGTIEGMAPDSWFELQFNDGSTVMISGTSMLTFADLGQKELRLREGIFSANVVPQPKGKPMLIHTPSTLLEVRGTQFDVEARLASTTLTVTEGEVRMRRLSDGREVDVPAKHRVIAEGDGDLTPQRVPESVNHWKSQLHLRPGGYGKWLPATQQRAAAKKAIPLVPPGNPGATLYLLGFPVSRSDGPPVVVRSDSRFVVRGRLNKPAKIHFGIAVSYVNGEFAGKFRGDLDGQQPISEPDEDGQFEVVYRIRDFRLDPCVRDREEELAVRPDDLVLKGVWAFTDTGGPSGLEVTEVELISPNKEEE
jgi:ferric-dicitrate binding protein FerR (iron transport regulator)